MVGAPPSSSLLFTLRFECNCTTFTFITGLHSARRLMHFRREFSISMHARWIDRVACWSIDAAVPAVFIAVAVALPEGFITTTETINGVQFQKTTPLGPPIAFYLLWLAAILFTLWNKGYCEGRSGKSLGKKALGFTTVAIATGKPLGVPGATARCTLLSIDFAMCYVGVLWPLWDERVQCLVSDKFLKAIVIRDSETKSPDLLNPQ